ncbi:hypothetical protein TNCV_1518971 [Trichonephila clavipes]|nr:hypothetical protein TNCV_1518971 [Trichonephila clavipes]
MGSMMRILVEKANSLKPKDAFVDDILIVLRRLSFLFRKKLLISKGAVVPTRWQTCHTAYIDLFKDTFGDRLFIYLPPSCDLTPLDYFLWGYVNIGLCKPQTLKDNIRRPIYGHKCWKKSSKIGRPDWATSEPAVAVLCQKSYLKCNATRLSFE